MKLAVITCYFNPCNYQQLRKNYIEFCERELARGVELFTLEAIWEGQEPPGFGKVIYTKPEQILFQKERMLNLLAESLPPEYDAVAWVDADIIFSNNNWPEDAEKALREYCVIQCFSEAIWLKQDGSAYGKRPASLYCHNTDFTQAHPGFAWAARREFFPLYDKHITGGGDSVNMVAYYGDFGSPIVYAMNIEWRRDFLVYGLHVWNRVHGNVGAIAGSASHVWHGSTKNRRYMDRDRVLTQNKYNPKVDLYIDDNGLFTFTRQDLSEAVQDLFISRKEDEE